MKNMRERMELCETVSASVVNKAARLFMSYVDWGGGDGESLMFELGFDEDEEVSPRNRAFRRKLKAWAESRIYDVEWTISSLFQDGLLTIWREITAPPDWTPTTDRHPGVYWSWDKHAAEAHGGHFGNGHVTWMMKAKVRYNQIDWPQTLAANISLSTGEEREITLKDNTPVKVLRYWQVGR